jgi:hypothetical protein
MYSVIIPTIWKNRRLERLLQELDKSSSVSEIILIDNFPQSKFIQDKLYSKLKIITTSTNYFVNPSWNLGVSVASKEFICLCNDDVNFDTSIFNYVVPQPNELVGIHNSCYSVDQNEPFEIEPVTTRCHGFGCLMFFKKESYTPIPEQLKIWFGDDFLFLKIQNKFQIKGLKIETEMSSSSELEEFKQIIETDKKYFLQNFN